MGDVPRTPPQASVSTTVAFGQGTRSDILLIAVIGIVVLGLCAVVGHRVWVLRNTPGGADSSMTRPVLAVLLVGTLLVLAAMSLDSDDTDTRNLLIGGVVSLSSAAAAFYFASSGATEARRDLLSVTSGQQVPSLVGMTVEQAQAVARVLNLSLTLPAQVPPAGAVVATQDPPPGGSLAGTRSITVGV